MFVWCLTACQQVQEIGVDDMQTDRQPVIRTNVTPPYN